LSIKQDKTTTWLKLSLVEMKKIYKISLSLSLSLSLSHTHTHTHTHIAYPTLDWLFELKRSYDQDPQVLSLTKQIQEGTSTYNRYTIKEDI